MSNEFEATGASASVHCCQESVAMTANRKPAARQRQVSETMPEQRSARPLLPHSATLFAIVLESHNYCLCNREVLCGQKGE